MKTYADALDDQQRAMRLVANPQPVMDADGVLCAVDAHLEDASIIGTADAYFISDDFMRLVDAAAQSLPHDAGLEQTDFPSGAGWMTFALPPQVDWLHHSDVGTALFVSDGSYSELGRRYAKFPPDGVFWLVSGEVAAFWLFSTLYGAPLGVVGMPISGGAESHSPLERWIKALWLLLGQQTVSELSEELLPRAARKRAERAGRRPVVRVIRLPRRVRERGEAEHGSVEWRGRWIVSGHWRRQPWGPGRSYTRDVWIAPYIKGPDDGPLLESAKRLFVAEVIDDQDDRLERRP